MSIHTPVTHSCQRTPISRAVTCRGRTLVGTFGSTFCVYSSLEYSHGAQLEGFTHDTRRRTDYPNEAVSVHICDRSCLLGTDTTPLHYALPALHASPSLIWFFSPARKRTSYLTSPNRTSHAASFGETRPSTRRTALVSVLGHPHAPSCAGLRVTVCPLRLALLMTEPPVAPHPDFTVVILPSP